MAATVFVSGEPILVISEVQFSYGRIQVLFGPSLEVSKGEALALLGTNGAGKSTLLRTVSGLERPTSGTVRFDGRDVTGVPAHVLASRGLTLVSGGSAVFRDMSVGENLEMQSLAMADRRRRYHERRNVVLDTFPRLRQRLRQLAGQLSGGEQQQLALAKALLLEPKLLCIDELSLGLAPLVVGELMDIVKSIHSQGVALLLVEQSLNIAAQLCDNAVFMEKGEVRFAGRTAELLERDDIARAVFFGEAARG